MTRLLEMFLMFGSSDISGSFDIPKASKMDTGAATPLRSGTGHAWRSILKREAIAAAYLRAAHAYILISMPTGNSTIFGVFQAIMALLVEPDELRPPG
jgi:hypothetical protein